MTDDHAPLVGALWATLAAVCFSCVDVLIKFLSDGYPLYQITFLRTLVALSLIGAIVGITGKGADLKTTHFKIQMLRGLLVVFANFLFFLGIAALPLAEAVAIFFVSPLLIAVFSILFLGETVGPRRWAAIMVGFLGVLIVLRPGTDAFQTAALLPIGAAISYGLLHILTRRIGTTDSTTSLVFYTQLVMLAVSSGAGLAFGHGNFNVYKHPSATFLLRAWVWPSPVDTALIVALGITIAAGGFAISAAYRRSDAAFIAPFEYVAMPFALVFGIVIFAEYPDRTALFGIALILGSGLFLIWREARIRRTFKPDAPETDKATLDAPHRV